MLYRKRIKRTGGTVSEVPVLSTSSKPSGRFRNRHVGHSVRLVAATCSFCGQTRPSASEVSPSWLLSSGTHFHLTSTHRSTVANSSDQSWKLIFSDKPTTLHDSSDNSCLRVTSVTVTVTMYTCCTFHGLRCGHTGEPRKKVFKSQQLVRCKSVFSLLRHQYIHFGGEKGQAWKGLPRNHVLCGVSYWHHLANTIKWSVCGSNLALC